MYKILLSALLALACNPFLAYGQLYCTNHTTQGVWLAIAYNFVEPTQPNCQINSWVTEGWLYVAPNDTAILSNFIGFDKHGGVKTNFFYYAYQVDGRDWSGPRKFLVDPNPHPVDPNRYDFRINDANLPEKHPNTDYVYVNFKTGVWGKDNSYTLVLSPDDQNDLPMTMKDKKNPFDANFGDSGGKSTPPPSNTAITPNSVLDH